ncbi:MAG: hypothetical protein AABY18_07755 [Candidatus Thermoplasmatota archaeon]
MPTTISSAPSWGEALRLQNDDEVVRCDRCDRAATLTGIDGEEADDDRSVWPSVHCVFDASCRGSMRRETLN